MSALWFDLRYTLRLLGKSPGFTALCVLVIALALGLALTIYVLVSNQGLKPIPIPNGERYVAHQFIDTKHKQTLWGDRFGPYTVETILQQSNSYEFIGAAFLHGSVTLSDGEITEAPFGTVITPRLLQLTGVVPLMGRNLLDSDALPEAEPVALIGHTLWQNYYAGRKDIIGHRSRVDGKMHTIVGVMPEGFAYPLDHHLWKPLQFPIDSKPGANELYLTPIGILKEGVSIEQATSELETIIANLANEYPDEYKNHSAKVVPYVFSASANNWTTMNAVMLGAAVIILLLACLNVGNLLLVRANERTQELVIRSALGGTRGRIIQQVLMESFVICIAGGALGIWLGTYGAQFIQYQTEVVVGSSYLPFWMAFEISSEMIALAILATLFIWLLAGGIPAWRASNLEINTALSGGGKGVTGKGSNKVAKTLVATEVICSFFLLVLSGAFVSAVHFSNQIDLGVSTENSVTGFVRLEGEKYEQDINKYQYFKNLTTALNDDPRIINATLTSALPGMSFWTTHFTVDDRDLKIKGEYPEQILIPVAANYFQSMDVALVAGRHFSESDNEDSLAVTIVEQSFAEKMWSQQSALGKRIQVNPDKEKYEVDQQWLTIVGVIKHIDQGQSFQRYRSMTSLYLPLAQETPIFSHFVVKFSEQPKQFEKLIKHIASRVDRDIPVKRVRSLGDSLFLNTKILQTLSELFVVVALIALVLAGTGIYGVVSRTVLLRTHEMGIRRSLGFTDSDTIRLFLRQGLFYLLAGALIGGGGAVVASYLLTAEFPNLLDYIFSIVIIITLLMSALVLLACYLPARKMVAMEPAAALHYE